MFCVRGLVNALPYAPTTRVGTLLSVPVIVSESIAVRWATKKSGGSTKNGRDSNPKYLGIKKYSGEAVKPGTWIIRQRGKKFHPGDNVTLGKDYTICADMIGRVKFETRTVSIRKFHHDPTIRKDVDRRFIHVVPFTWETRPSTKEMERVGLSPIDVEKQIEQGQVQQIQKWTQEVLDGIDSRAEVETHKQQALTQQRQQDKVHARKHIKFQKHLRQLRIKHGNATPEDLAGTKITAEQRVQFGDEKTTGPLRTPLNIY